MLNIINKLLRYRKPQYSSGVLAGKQVICLPGVLRSTNDYDDAWFFALASRCRNIMDIGANKGYTALLALASGADKRLLLVDANAEALGLACQNICMNDLGGRVLYQRALVSDQKGKELQFFTVGAGDAGSIHASHAKTAAQMNRSQRMMTTTVDDIASDYEFDPDLVKLDVEGAEVEALRGAPEIASSDAMIMVEMHSTDGLPMKDAARKVIDWADNHGRTVYYMKAHEVLDNPDTVSHRGKCHFLILKNNVAYPDYLKSIPQGAPVSEALVRASE